MFFCPYDHHKAATGIIGWRNVAAKIVRPLLAQKVSKEIGFHSSKVKHGVGKSNHILSASCMMAGRLAGHLSYVTSKERLRETQSGCCFRQYSFGSGQDYLFDH